MWICMRRETTLQRAALMVVVAFLKAKDPNRCVGMEEEEISRPAMIVLGLSLALTPILSSHLFMVLLIIVQPRLAYFAAGWCTART